MAWNQAGKSNAVSSRRDRSKHPVDRKWAMLLGGIVLLLGVCVIVPIFLKVDSNRESKPRAADKPKQIQERKVEQPTNDAPQKAVQDRKGPRERPVLTPEEAQAMLAERRAKGEVIRNLRMGADGKPRYRILFHNPAEREISRLLTHRPGAPMMGIVRYDAAFERQFMDSLKTPVEIVPEDTPREIELKNTVEATKKEIMQRIKDGETLKDILEGTRKEIDRLARYRSDLVKMINEAKKNGEYSESDFRDLVGAANKMLEENGMRPVSKSIFTTRAIQNMSNTKEVIR